LRATSTKTISLALSSFSIAHYPRKELAFTIYKGILSALSSFETARNLNREIASFVSHSN